jgi:hypothetical protein
MQNKPPITRLSLMLVALTIPLYIYCSEVKLNQDEIKSVFAHPKDQCVFVPREVQEALGALATVQEQADPQHVSLFMPLLCRESIALLSDAQQAVDAAQQMLTKLPQESAQLDSQAISRVIAEYAKELASEEAFLSIMQDDAPQEDDGETRKHGRKKIECNLLVRNVLRVGKCLLVRGREIIDGDLFVNGPVTINFPQNRVSGIDALTVIGNTQLVGNLTVEGQVTIKSLGAGLVQADADGNLSTTSGGGGGIFNNATLTGTTTFNGPIVDNSTLDVLGATTLTSLSATSITDSGPLTVAGLTSLNGGANVTGGLTADNLTVTGTLTFGNLSVTSLTVDNLNGVVHATAGLLSAGPVTNADIVDNTISGAKITDATITNAKLATIDSANTPGDIVVRDGSGNFAAGDITATDLLLPNSTTTTGNVYKNNLPFIHNVGINNTAIGVSSANLAAITALECTACGFRALSSATSGGYNTAVGSRALTNNTTGNQNIAVGTTALFTNQTGSENTAVGMAALSLATIGPNSAFGCNALWQTTTGVNNTACGNLALAGNVTGSDNTAVGDHTLRFSLGNIRNTAVGSGALENIGDGSNNIAIGYHAGTNSINTESNNIYIGHLGVNAESATIRLGTSGTQTTAFIQGINGVTVAGAVPVVIGATGQMGTVVSSRRFKDTISDMGASSDKLLELRPVTFTYKTDKSKSQQYGLIAEEVLEHYPDLVVLDADGQPLTIQYHLLTPMLLNELKKQKSLINRQETTINKQVAIISDLLQRTTQSEATLASIVEQLRKAANGK